MGFQGGVTRRLKCLLLALSSATIALVGLSTVSSAAEVWDQPPLSYSDAQADDPLARLMADVEAGKKSLPQKDARGFLIGLLEALDVPVESQVLVFSKTSKQVQLIGPGNPRAIYFSDNTYVAWVPGGTIEVIAHDSKLGPVFYEIEPSYSGGPVNFKRSGTCLACHVPSYGAGALGLTLRSVQTQKSGTPIHIVEAEVSHRTPYEKRWGGWYVTGRMEGLKHLGNMVGLNATKGKVITTIPVARYPRVGSDVVALMVLDHQVCLYSLITKASTHYRRSLWLEKASSRNGAVKPGGEGSTSARLADRMAEEILQGLLFCGEAKLTGDGVEGDEAFQKAFQKNAHRVGDRKRSLKDFRLYGYLFKNRCSYMIDSDGFRDLPEGVKSVVLKRLDEVLQGRDKSGKFDHLGERERSRISDILNGYDR